jgi:hypothetical protein
LKLREPGTVFSAGVKNAETQQLRKNNFLRFKEQKSAEIAQE